MTNTTPTVRVRFENELRPYFNQNEADIVWSFIEKEISEAEARGEARMREKCIAIIPDPEPLAEMGFDAEALASFLSFNISSL